MFLGRNLFLEGNIETGSLKCRNKLVLEHHTWANRNNDESSRRTVGNGGAGDEKAADD